jgi:regulator of protease activity HflC (stomatin/prohibitin superfamily)
MPLLDTVVYSHSLKEQVLEIDHQTAITRDNVKITINGILYYKVVDAYKASYNVN